MNQQKVVNMKQLSYSQLKDKLTEQDINEIAAILSYRCRIATHNKIVSRLKYFASSIPYYGITERLTKENDRWTYCAGQSYTDEIRTLRKIFLTEYVKGNN